MAKSIKKYTGEALNKPKSGFDAYIPDPELVEAVNLAIFLERPLLLTGDPGSGKTRLAESVAFEWYPENCKKYMERWDIKSTSKAKEGLYTFDNLKRLYDVQAGNLLDDKTEYRELGKLANAFETSINNKAILLIDEIDKAPIDFPNDLLLELEEKKFNIPETIEEKSYENSPLIIITSNREKELPPAFLRRCIYHHIKFLGKEKLEKILQVNRQIDNELIEEGLKFFIEIRKKQETQNQIGEKLVSTSEMLDWFKYLSYISQTTNTKEEIIKSLKNKKILYPQSLFKKDEDYNLFSENLKKDI